MTGLVYFGGGIMAIVCVILAFQRTFWACPVLGFVFGIGYGAFNSIDYALALDVLPSQEVSTR